MWERPQGTPPEAWLSSLARMTFLRQSEGPEPSRADIMHTTYIMHTHVYAYTYTCTNAYVCTYTKDNNI